VFYYHMVFRRFWHNSDFLMTELATILSQTQDDKVQAIHIDTSTHVPVLHLSKKIYVNPPSHAQEMVVKHILKEYGDGKYKNVKVLLSGPRGVGKSTVGSILKKELDKLPGIDSHLFDDFNPTLVGVNVRTLILPKAAEKSPVILVSDEFDVAMEETIRPNKQIFDTRLCHTTNKITFDAMLDIISQTKFVIALYTTEKTFHELQQDPLKRSFLRKGRMDWDIYLPSSSANPVITPIP